MTRQETTDWIYGAIRTYGEGDLISDCLVAYGEWARTEVEFICKYLLPPHGNFIDVGAFIGTHTIPFALHVGKEGNGISFEPNGHSYSLLTENLRLAGVQNVTAYNVAASHSSGLAFSLFSDPHNLGNTTLHHTIATSAGSAEDEVRCQSKAIDDLNLDHVDLIKVDVEGMERNVLSGSINLIERCKPNIFLELNSLEEHAFIFELAKQFNYFVQGVRTVAFNPLNHKNNPINTVLGNGVELGIVLTTQRLASIGTGPEAALIVQPLEDLDELGTFLLSKPQYRSRLMNGALTELLGTAAYLSVSNVSPFQELVEQSYQLRSERAQLLEQATQLQQELLKAHEDYAGLKEKLNQSLEEGRQARAEAELARQLASAATSELAEAHARLDEAHQIRQQSLMDLQAITGSRSWAITKPYRKLASLIRGLSR